MAASISPPLSCWKSVSDSFEVAVVGVARTDGANVVVTVIQFLQRLNSGIRCDSACAHGAPHILLCKFVFERRLAGHARADPTLRNPRLRVPFHEVVVGSNREDIRTLISGRI